LKFLLELLFINYRQGYSFIHVLVSSLRILYVVHSRNILFCCLLCSCVCVCMCDCCNPAFCCQNNKCYVSKV